MTCCPDPDVEIAVTEATEQRDRLLAAELQASAHTLQDGAAQYVLAVPAIHCGACISTIERSLSRVEGVRAARANLTMRQVSVTLDSPGRSPLEMIRALEAQGYSAHALDHGAGRGSDPEFDLLVRALAVAGFAMANIMLLSVSVWAGAGLATTGMFHFISALIAIPAVAYGGRPFFRSAVSALRHGRVNMDVPISLGVLLATAMSLYETLVGGTHAYFDAAVSLLFFLLIGRVLDHLMRSKARDAIGRLGRLAAKGGLVVNAAGETTYRKLDEIMPGMVLRVAAGERIPVDGHVVAGVSDIDRSLVTGESAAVPVAAGAVLEAGCLNLTGVIDLRADREARFSFLSEVMQMMAAAEQGRGHYVRLADRMARLYAPVVHVLSLGTLLFWLAWTGGDWHSALTTAIAVLIITCPCALGLAVPVAHVVAASRLFGAGVMMKDGSALERLAEIDAVAFDKTGTLTTGITVADATGIPPGREAAIARALALRSVHPAARALASAIGEEPATGLDDLREVPGQGVEARIGQQVARLGRPAWVQEIALGDHGRGAGVAFALQGAPLHLIALHETLRPGAAEVVAAFAGAGIPSRILSGDAVASVERISKEAGIALADGGLRPGDKLSLLQQQSAAGRKVLMVGDGLNDAPALAAAHVSMAPSSGSDTGRQAADFVFTRPDLGAVWLSWRVASAAGRIVRQNFALAIVYNLLAVPLAMAGALNPLIAAVAMSSSSILVVANSMRLRLMRFEQTAPETQAARPVPTLLPTKRAAA